MNTIIGLDIGGTKIAVIEGTYEANILQRREIATQAQDSFESTFTRICTEIDAVIVIARNAGREVKTISVSIGGPLKIDEGFILSPPHLPNWVNIPLKDRLFKRYALPISVEHDGNAGALAEYYFGAGRGTRNMIFLTAGTGFGGGFILDGHIYRGSTDTAGEVGHIRLSQDGPTEYGKAGSWEAYCSGAGMVKLALSMFPDQFHETLTTHELVSSALEGEGPARQVIAKSGEWLGRGLALLVDLLNPEVIVIGSLGWALGDLLLEPARKVVHAECLPQPADACRIVPAELGTSIGDIAALIAAIDAQNNLKTHEVASPSPGALFIAMAESIQVQESLAKVGNVIGDSGVAICRALEAGRKVIVFGNGGSAAQAQHLASELVGKYGPVRKSLPSLALTADSGVVTCIANDFGYDQVFSRQVEAFTQPGDVVIGMTTSGKSANVLRALEVAHERGAITIALTGEKGLVGLSADYVVAVPSRSTARIQEAHAFIVHYWCDVIDATFA